ncbi:MAG: hypothetical protein HYX71_04710 [Opitutae bacterium]|nr:hypothetical protein [Opitutae bacterium]
MSAIAPHCGRRRKHVAVAWVPPAGLECYDLAPADLPVIARLRATA